MEGERETEEMAATEVRVISRCMVQPSSCNNGGEEEGQQKCLHHLTPWDIKMLSIDYIQKGILFPKHHQLLQQQHEEEEEQQQGKETRLISNLRSSFSHTLDHFFPLAGRLVTAKHDTTPPSLSISLDGNNEGSEFIHALAADITVSDILTPTYIPPIIHSFFPLNGVLSIDGHSLPLLAVQVTELADGFFIGCSLNHAVADGTTFWHFFNSWSAISRTGTHQIPHPPVLDRWFLESCSPPIRLPFQDHQEFIKRTTLPPVRECIFHFSAKSIAKLKAKANKEMESNRISSLQALLGHVWRSVTRARGLVPRRESTYFIFVGSRSRINPPLPGTYLGNSVYGVPAKATAGELLERGLGWSALVLNQAVASQSEAEVRRWLEKWPTDPSFTYMNEFMPCDLVTGSSPRFDVYGNDFGWGKPVAVRSGCGNKIDGKVTVYPGPEEGSMALEVCLSPNALSSLVEDMEFMEAVTRA